MNQHKNLFVLVTASMLAVPVGKTYGDQDVANIRSAAQSPTTRTQYEIPLVKGQIKATGSAEVAIKGSSIRLQFDNPYSDSGLEVSPLNGQASWDLSAWKQLAVDIENRSPNTQMRLLMEISTNGTTRKANVGIGLNPGEKRTMRLLLPHQWQFAHPEDSMVVVK